MASWEPGLKGTRSLCFSLQRRLLLHCGSGLLAREGRISPGLGRALHRADAQAVLVSEAWALQLPGRGGLLFPIISLSSSVGTTEPSGGATAVVLHLSKAATFNMVLHVAVTPQPLYVCVCVTHQYATPLDG